MKITKGKAKREDWDLVRSWNYKLPGELSGYQSVVYAELDGDHGSVSTESAERIHFVIAGSGEFLFAGKTIEVEAGDVLTVPPNTEYDYKPTKGTTLKVLLFMELWDN